MKPENRNMKMLLMRQMNFAFFKGELCYPELYVEEYWRNRPVVWFVAKREGYNGMVLNNDITEDSTDVSLMELLANEEDTLSQESSLKVYPNPFEDYFIVESSSDDEILIQEPTGRIIKQQKISKGSNRVHSKRISSEVYFVRFVNQNKSFKLIKR